MNPQGFVHDFQSHEMITEVVFADVENGKAIAFYGWLRLKHPSDQVPSIQSKTLEIPQGAETTLDFPDVVNDFKAGKYKQEELRWGTQLGLVSLHDYQLKFWRQLAVWSVEYAHNYKRGELVGGDVDVAKISPSGVQWLSRKSSCKEVE